MKAITTRYVGPTNTKPARIIATAEGGNKVTIGFHSSDKPYQAAALALCKKLNWTGTLVEGGIEDGYVYCFLQSDHVAIPKEDTRQGCMNQVCYCHVDPHPAGYSCPSCGCVVVGEEK